MDSLIRCLKGNILQEFSRSFPQYHPVVECFSAELGGRGFLVSVYGVALSRVKEIERFIISLEYKNWPIYKAEILPMVCDVNTTREYYPEFYVVDAAEGGEVKNITEKDGEVFRIPSVVKSFEGLDWEGKESPHGRDDAFFQAA